MRQSTCGSAREVDGQRVPLPSLQTHSDLPREWPMARLAISNKQINRLVRTFLWRQETEQALNGSSFVDIPDEINQACIGDLLRISEAFAAPLSNLFTFVKGGHPACPFITHKQLALYPNPWFWQCGFLPSSQQEQPKQETTENKGKRCRCPMAMTFAHLPMQILPSRRVPSL